MISRRRLVSVHHHGTTSPTPTGSASSPAPSSAHMNKRSRTAGPEAEAQTTMVSNSTTAVEFKVDYEQTKNFAPGMAIHSDAISAGGHMWRINWYPHGMAPSPRGMASGGNTRGVSMTVELMGKSGSVEAMVAVCLMKRGKSSSVASSKVWSLTHVFGSDVDECGWDPSGKNECGWVCLLLQTELLNYYVIDGHITAYCTIMVLHDGSIIPAPPSDIVKHLGALLDSTDGADVSFMVDGETFHAHRALLASRSSVFRAELLGSMSEATMTSVTLHDIAPATFRIMLRFMYTDVFPGDNELGDSPTEMFKHLLAAADRYALDRLKIMCAQKLWESVSVDTVSDALAFAETYSCPELKSKCIEFVVAEENFKKAVLTESFMQLWLKFPSIVAELRERVSK